jgi:hypothetical protein
MTFVGDMIIRNGSNVTARLGVGANNSLLTVVGGVPTWLAPFADTRIPFSSGGVLISSASLTWDNGAGRLSLTGGLFNTNNLQIVAASKTTGALLRAAATSGSHQAEAWLAYNGTEGPSGVLAVAVSSGVVPYRAYLRTGVVNSIENAIVIQSGNTFGFSTMAGFGVATLVRLTTSIPGALDDAARYAVAWSDATTATRSAYHAWSTVHLAGAMTERMRLTSDGVLRVGTDTIYFGLRPGASGTPVWTMPIADGTSGQVLSTDGAGVLSWISAGGGMSDPMTTVGDMIFRNGSNVTARLPVGSASTILASVGGVPTWGIAGIAAGRVLYSTGAALGSESAFTYNETTNGLTITGISNSSGNLGLQMTGTQRGANTAIGHFGATNDGSATMVYYPGGGQPGLRSCVYASSVNPDYLPLQLLRVNAGHTSGAIMPYIHYWVQPTTTGVANEGASMLWTIRTSNGTMQDAAVYAAAWSDATTATRSAYHAWSTVHFAGAMTERMRLTSDGVLRVGTTSVYFGLVPGGSGTPVWTMPIADGTSGQVLSTDGAGVLSWITAGGFVDPMTTNGDILIRSGGTTTRLGIGTAGQVLTVVSGLPAWQNASSGFADPMTTAGDIIVRNGSNVTTRLGIGSTGQFLRVVSGVPAWETVTLYSDPLTTNGDILIRSGGTTTRLGIGTDGQVLTVVSGLPAWQNASSGFADPMTTAGDIIVRNGSNVTTRLGIGSTGQFLRVVSGVPAWETVTLYSDPLTTNGDILIRSSGTTTRLPIGSTDQFLRVVSGAPTWSTVVLYSDPLTTNGDILVRSGGTTTRLGIGTDGQVLTVVSGAVSWQTPSSGFTDPMTTAGDIIVRNGSNVTTRLGVGSTGQFLRVVSGVPAWETVTLYSDPLTTNGDILIRSGGTTTRLPIGSTDQFLRVVSGAPTWSTVTLYSDPLTTNGDILIRSGGTTTRLPIGSSGQVLTVVSGTPAWSAVGIEIGTTTIAGGGTRRILFQDTTLQSDAALTWSATNGLSSIVATAGQRPLYVSVTASSGTSGPMIHSGSNWNISSVERPTLMVQSDYSSALGSPNSIVTLTLNNSTALTANGGPVISFRAFHNTFVDTVGHIGFVRQNASTTYFEVAALYSGGSNRLFTLSGLNGLQLRSRTASASGVEVLDERLVGVSSGTVTSGWGHGNLIRLTTTAGSTAHEDAVRIDSTWTDPVSATATSQYAIQLRNAGAALANALVLAPTSLNISSGTGELRVANTRVVGARITGWQMPTGTQARTTFDTSAVTLPQLAQRVYALINDLFGHGLIGT